MCCPECKNARMKIKICRVEQKLDLEDDLEIGKPHKKFSNGYIQPLYTNDGLQFWLLFSSNEIEKRS